MLAPMPVTRPAFTNSRRVVFMLWSSSGSSGCAPASPCAYLVTPRIIAAALEVSNLFDRQPDTPCSAAARLDSIGSPSGSLSISVSCAWVGEARRRRPILWVGVDVGGTFTDVVVYDEATETLRVGKSPTDPADPARGLLHAF